MPNKLSRFWQELKRRRVVHVITVYASAAFVLIELLNNLTEPLNLPSSLATIVIIVLAVGFPLAVILSWIYDLTGEGIVKTTPLSELEEEQKRTVPSAWKIATYISFIVIIGLVTFNIIGGRSGLRPGDIQSLLVLPFENYTGDDQLDIVISGMHSSLIGDIGRISGFTVISKTTSDVYKDTDKTLSQIASEMGVDAIIEPAVMCLGDSFCFEVKMITPDEKQIMFAEYHEAKGQILNVHNRVTKQISDKVKNELTPDEKRLLAESRTADPDALEAYFRGLVYWEKLTKEDFEMARQFFERAIEIDPDWGPPYAGMADVWFVQVFFGYISEDLGIPEAYKYLDKAIELDPNSAKTHYTQAQIAAWYEWDWVTAEREYLQSLELNPNDELCHMYYSHMLMCLRRFDEAVFQAQLGLELDPGRPLVLALYGVVMRCEGDYQSAIEHFEKALSIDPNFGFAESHLYVTYLYAGDYKNWITYYKEVTCWDDTVKTNIEKNYYKDGLVFAIEKLIEYNDMYGSPDCQMGFGEELFSVIFVNDYDRILDFLEELFESNWGSIAYIASGLLGDYNQLKDYPRYTELLKKMNLPLPDD